MRDMLAKLQNSESSEKNKLCAKIFSLPGKGPRMRLCGNILSFAAWLLYFE
jgi:hypothetical protein